MKRYIRTKDGKIIDLQAKNISSVVEIDEETADKEYGWECAFIMIFYYDDTGCHCERDDKGGVSMNNWDLPDIIKQSDTIEDLIMVGDLVLDNAIGVNEVCAIAEKSKYIEHRTLQFRGNGFIFTYPLYEHCGLTEIYTKQENDYVLVWTKEKGVI